MSDGSDGCAIGRKISKRLAKKLDNSIGLGGDDGASVSSDSIFELLPQKLQKLGQDFLSDIQDFHDDKNNWENKKAIQRKRLKHVKEMKIPIGGGYSSWRQNTRKI